jgi:hypothetical protein
MYNFDLKCSLYGLAQHVFSNRVVITLLSKSWNLRENIFLLNLLANKVASVSNEMKRPLIQAIGNRYFNGSCWKNVNIAANIKLKLIKA